MSTRAQVLRNVLQGFAEFDSASDHRVRAVLRTAVQALDNGQTPAQVLDALARYLNDAETLPPPLAPFPPGKAPRVRNYPGTSRKSPRKAPRATTFATGSTT